MSILFRTFLLFFFETFNLLQFYPFTVSANLKNFLGPIVRPLSAILSRPGGVIRVVDGTSHLLGGGGRSASEHPFPPFRSGWILPSSRANLVQQLVILINTCRLKTPRKLYATICDVKLYFVFQSPGYSTEMLTSSLDEYEYPNGNYWQENKAEHRPPDDLARFKKRRKENDK